MDVKLEHECAKGWYYGYYGHKNKNTFQVQFNNSQSESGIESRCKTPSQLKCTAFWNLVDSTPQLQQFIKEGMFIHASKPEPIKALDCKKEVKKRDSDYEFYYGRPREPPPDPNVLSKQVKNRTQEDRNRIKKRKEATQNLQKKSGQVIVKAKPEVPPSSQFFFSDEVD